MDYCDKVGRTTSPFRYDLNQIPYDYTVEVRNRFKGLDLIDRVPDELWKEVRDTEQETGIKTIPMEKKCKKVGGQETPEVTGKFGLGIRNEAGQRLIEFCQENTLVIANTLFQQHKRRLYTWTSPDGQHRNQTDYILAAKDGEALYSQQKQDQELTVAQIMNSLLPNSDL